MESTQTTPSPAAAPAVELDPDTPVTLTSKAVDMVRITQKQEGIDESYALRIAVRGGGCSGFEYALDFDNEARANDYSYEQNGLRILVDAVSARYLVGTQIDYVLGHTGAGFKFHNPKATGTCGCGSSFAV